jgi:hypothetical protein
MSKQGLIVAFWFLLLFGLFFSMVQWSKDLRLTPTTANKLSEAISAVVANVTASEPFKQNYVAKAEEARKSYQESQ